VNQVHFTQEELAEEILDLATKAASLFLLSQILGTICGE
jgi:hypothetical protein